MLHPAFMKELLDDEVALAAQRLGDRAAGLTHDGRYITCHLEGSTGAQVYLRLDAPAYDAEPVRVAVCDLEGSPLPEPLWPLAYGRATTRSPASRSSASEGSSSTTRTYRPLQRCRGCGLAASWLPNLANQTPNQITDRLSSHMRHSPRYRCTSCHLRLRVSYAAREASRHIYCRVEGRPALPDPSWRLALLGRHPDYVRFAHAKGTSEYRGN